MPRQRPGLAAPTVLSPEGRHQSVRVIIETPKGSRNKYAYNEDLRAFELKKVLPAGMAFPYDFGFVPGTKGGDGDPLDVLVLMDEPAFTGCVLNCRLIGIIKGEQKPAKGPKVENDRVVAVEVNTHSMAAITELEDLGKEFVQELEQFFVNYHGLDGEDYRIIDDQGRKAARRCLKHALQTARR